MRDIIKRRNKTGGLIVVDVAIACLAAATALFLFVAIVRWETSIDSTPTVDRGASGAEQLPRGAFNPFVKPPCPAGQVLVSDGYAPGACHPFDTLPPDEKQAAGNFPCPASQSVEIVNVGRWTARCAT